MLRAFWIPDARRALPRYTVDRAAVLIGILAIWELGGRTVGGPLLPTFTATMASLFSQLFSAKFAVAFVSSNQALVIGFGVTLTLGVLLGLLMGTSRLANQLIGPYLQMFLVAPVIALVPLVLIFLGLTLSARVFIVIMFSLPPVAFNTRAGIQSVDSGLVEMARSCGARGWFLWRRVLLPGALPGILSGVWVAVGRAISGMIIAELTIIAAGLGGLMRDFMDSFNEPGLFAVTLVLVFEGLALTAAARAIARHFMPHHQEAL